jgi:hypothetical protein
LVKDLQIVAQPNRSLRELPDADIDASSFAHQNARQARL